MGSRWRERDGMRPKRDESCSRSHRSFSDLAAVDAVGFAGGHGDEVCVLAESPPVAHRERHRSHLHTHTTANAMVKVRVKVKAL